MNESETPERHLGGLFEDLGEWEPARADGKSSALAAGLVALDANVLLDLYRFGAVARGDLLGILDKLGDRLFVPHQAALEFARNRVKVALDTREELKKGAGAAKTRLQEQRETLLNLMRRTGAPTEQQDAVLTALDTAAQEVDQMLTQALAERTWTDTPSSSDPVLPHVEALLDRKVGPRYPGEREDELRKKATERYKKGIPPGWEDFERKPDASGDFLLWRQVMDEAKLRGLPVLLVSEERKNDWLHKVNNFTFGPLPAMVREMREEAGVEFYLTNVSGLLDLAPKVLSAEVSDEAINEAKVQRRGVDFAWSAGVSEAKQRNLVLLPVAEHEALMEGFQRAIEPSSSDILEVFRERLAKEVARSWVEHYLASAGDSLSRKPEAGDEETSGADEDQDQPDDD